jgi:hypothetical protein
LLLGPSILGHEIVEPVRRGDPGQRRLKRLWGREVPDADELLISSRTGRPGEMAENKARDEVLQGHDVFKNS